METYIRQKGEYVYEVNYDGTYYGPVQGGREDV